MDLPQGRVGSQFWQGHAEQFKKFNGSKKAYALQHGLAYHKVIYYTAKFSKKMVTASKPAGFAKVQVSPMAKPLHPAVLNLKSYPQLPDPKWLSELIHNLSGHR